MGGNPVVTGNNVARCTQKYCTLNSSGFGTRETAFAYKDESLSKSQKGGAEGHLITQYYYN